MSIEYLSHQIHSNLILPLSLVSIFLLTQISIVFYKLIATKVGIISQMNERTRHKTERPRGAGIVFSFTFLFGLVYFYFLGSFQDLIVFQIFSGAIAASIFGFLDDVFDIKATYKLMVQILLALWIIYSFAPASSLQISLGQNYYWLFIAPILFILVWILNVFNFMDGVDGMLVSGCFIALFSANLFLLYMGGSSENLIIMLLLMTVCLSFLVFNFPPASVFMGDAGSLFLGFSTISIVLKTYFDGDLELWTWFILFGYFLSDTFVTTAVRLFTIKNWFGEHRSHAYQNLAKQWDSHFKITIGVILYQLIFLVPLAFMSVLKPELGFVLFLFSIFPVILLTLKYGPLFSNQ